MDRKDCLVNLMKKTSCLAFITFTLCASVCANVLPAAAAGTVSRLLACKAEIPMIPLEKSLVWTDKSASSLVPDSSTAYRSTHAAANALIRGLLVANRTGEIGFSNILSYRVQDVVRNLRRGKSLMFAGDRSSVSTHVLARLLQLGNRNTVN
jgi:hypothetical protein